jgi:molybdate transport system ATP-binding protein
VTLRFDAQVAARRFDVGFGLEDGQTLAVLGPNGAGKSTLLGVLSGLLRPDSGSAEVDRTPLFRISRGERGFWAPPHTRGVSLMTQRALLFPHLSVLDNVAFGPSSLGAPRRAARTRAMSLLSLVEAAVLAPRRPSALSGGQAQRVAVARALASDPRLLLLDEPMAALDITVVPQLRRVLKQVLRDRTAIIVTHDVLDAYSLADVVAVMNDGKIVEMGEPGVVLQRPRSAFAAALAGLNLVTGTRSPHGLLLADSSELRVADAPDVAQGTRVSATVAPAVIRVTSERPAMSDTMNARLEVVTELEPRGETVRVHLGALLADVPASEVARLELDPGASAWASFAASEVTMYPTDDEPLSAPRTTAR